MEIFLVRLLSYLDILPIFHIIQVPVLPNSLLSHNKITWDILAFKMYEDQSNTRWWTILPHLHEKFNEGKNQLKFGINSLFDLMYNFLGMEKVKN